jgi:hypothetical protein
LPPEMIRRNHATSNSPNPSAKGIGWPVFGVEKCQRRFGRQGPPTIERCRLKDTANKCSFTEVPASLSGDGVPISPISPPAPRLLSVTESIALPPQPNRRSEMPDTPKLDFREWLVPPVLLPVFLSLLIAAAVVLQW